ncbi:hypothetical protein RUM43_009926 [Polyplax serrata]|uniref:Uncharacterized protein n=1 Tax=Polyplax serrata TaxID=468196 RepID=A0AAN8S001_POLSC
MYESKCSQNRSKVNVRVPHFKRTKTPAKRSIKFYQKMYKKKIDEREEPEKLNNHKPLRKRGSNEEEEEEKTTATAAAAAKEEEEEDGVNEIG